MAKKKKIRQKSSGFVTFVEVAGNYNVLILDHGQHVSHPKGHLKKNETKREAAIRELKEETNLDPQIESNQILYTNKYTIESRSRIIDKTVYYYATIAGGEIAISKEHKRYFLLIPKQARDTLTFDTDKYALDAALDWLELISSH